MATAKMKKPKPTYPKPFVPWPSSKIQFLPKLTAAEVEFSLEIVEEEGEVDFDSGQPKRDKKIRKEILERLESGDSWAWCTVVVTAKRKSWEGVDSLGNCSYEDEADFCQEGGYYEGMKEYALEDLNNNIAKCAGRDRIGEQLAKGGE